MENPTANIKIDLEKEMEPSLGANFSPSWIVLFLMVNKSNREKPQIITKIENIEKERKPPTLDLKELDLLM